MTKGVNGYFGYIVFSLDAHASKKDCSIYIQSNKLMSRGSYRGGCPPRNVRLHIRCWGKISEGFKCELGRFCDTSSHPYVGRDLCKLGKNFHISALWSALR